MSSIEVAHGSMTDVVRQERRFAVAWRNRAVRRVSAVGVLDHAPGTFAFRYLPDVGQAIEDFRPFIGFPDLARTYQSPRLWPFFSLRVMDRRRPDYTAYLRSLGLEPGADRLDVLARSGGERKGDTVSVIEEPTVAPDGVTEAVFLARGSRYAVEEHRSADAAAGLRAGDRLLLAADSTNVANRNAVLLTTESGAAVGWVPDLLVSYTQRLDRNTAQAEVLQNNGPSAPWHLRLLVRLAGTIVPPVAAFSGEEWPKRIRTPLPLHS